MRLRFIFHYFKLCLRLGLGIGFVLGLGLGLELGSCVTSSFDISYLMGDIDSVRARVRVLRDKLFRHLVLDGGHRL